MAGFQMVVTVQAARHRNPALLEKRASCMTTAAYAWFVGTRLKKRAKRAYGGQAASEIRHVTTPSGRKDDRTTHARFN